MQLRRNHRRLALVVAFGFGAAGLALAAPARAQEPTAQAQTGGRMRILIPNNLEHPQGADEGFGKKLDDALRASVDKLNTHVSVPNSEIKDNLKKYKIDEKDLDCIKARQLAVQMNVELVMCGSYEPQAGGNMKVSTQFIGAKTGETFEVPAVTAPAALPAQAAAQVFSAFQNYVTQLRAASICNQYLGSQQWKSALDNCNAALQVNSQSSSALYGRARALMEMDSLPAAYEALKQVIKINPMHSDGLRAAGVVAAKLGNEEESRDYFRQYLELNPGAAGVRLSLAGDAAKAGDPEGALKMVEDGFKTDSANTQLLLFAGHWALAASQKVEETARKAGQDKPAKADSLAMVALNYYRRLITLSDTAADPVVVRNAMLIMTNHDQAAQAVTLGQKFSAVRHDDPYLWSAYANALEASGQLQRARAILDSARVYDKKGELPIDATEGQWLAERGQVAEARASLARAVQRGKLPGDDAAQLLIGIGLRDHLNKGDAAGAIDYLAAGRGLASSGETRGMAAYWTGYILFQRGSAAAKAATTQPARVRAAAIFRDAQAQFDAAGAYVQANPRIRSAVEQMSSYVETYTKAVAKASGTEKGQ
jgi:tetratricopeptide (TPR) repeat protein